ncbi:hypothetical protein [Streptomyces sp. NPDC048606]|uniref:hypothetical protein n=1 Tax=Streptomyces sp. NPDC048606 TaxID=3154726 RepID=UPI0034470963
MTTTWGPDRPVRRNMLALGATGLVLIAAGAFLGLFWLLGLGVWAVVASLLIELVYRP